MLGMLDGDFEFNAQQKVAAPSKFNAKTARIVAEKAISDKERPALQEQIILAAKQGVFSIMLHTRPSDETAEWLKELGFKIDYTNGEWKVQW